MEKTYKKAVIKERGVTVPDAVHVYRHRRVEADVMDFDFEVRSAGNLAGLGFALPEEYDWDVVRDSEGALVLLPRKPSVRA